MISHTGAVPHDIHPYHNRRNLKSNIIKVISLRVSQIFLKNKSTDFLREDLVFTDKGLKAETKLPPVGPEVAFLSSIRAWECRGS